jgi:uncharacterized protein (DUF305 family)
MQNNKTILVSVITLVIGLLIGTQIDSRPKTNSHRMPDGSMMANSHSMGDMESMMKQMNAELIGKTNEAFDKAFLNEMIVHHEGAVEMAKLALTNTKRPELLELAKMIITAQEKEIAEMKNWQNTWFK